MREFVLDANAVIRYLKMGGGVGGDRVEALLEQSKRGQLSLLMSAINFGEVYYISLCSLDELSTAARLDAVRKAVSVIPADAEQAVDAARVKHRYRLSYADSFAASLALQRGATLVSADPSFEQCGRALKWLRLPPFRG